MKSEKDLQEEYASIKDTVKRFGHWEEMDRFVLELTQKVGDYNKRPISIPHFWNQKAWS